MWPRVIGMALALTGCDAVFGLDRTCVGVDEDCDGIANAVDPCPADLGTGDRDGDGVGDACDPNPDVPIDSIALFEPFTVPDPEWVLASMAGGDGVWAFERDALVQSSITDAGYEHPPPMNRQPTVEVVIDPDFGGEGSSVGAYVVGALDVPLECRVVHHVDGDELVVLLGYGAGSPVAMMGPIPGSGRLRLYGGQLPNGMVRCLARYGEEVGVHIDYEVPLIDKPATFAKLGLRTIEASAAFESLTVYTTN